jgi:hypothetical protein
VTLVATLWAVSACATDPAPAETEAGTEGHHEHTAPHGGTLVELGDEFAHVELVFESGAGRIAAFVLDGEAEQAVRLAQPTLPIVLEAPPGLAGRPLELAPVASKLTGERVGDASEFVFADARLKGHQGLRGSLLSIDVRGQTFRDVPFVVPGK